MLRNRVRARTRQRRLAKFLAEIEHADLGALPDRAIYNDVAAEGLSIFDLAGTRSAALQQDWAPVLGYVALDSSPIRPRRRKAEERGAGAGVADLSRRHDVDPSRSLTRNAAWTQRFSCCSSCRPSSACSYSCSAPTGMPRGASEDSTRLT